VLHNLREKPNFELNRVSKESMPARTVPVPFEHAEFLDAGAGVAQKSTGWKVPTPVGYKSKPAVFKDQCLLISLVLARLWEKVLKYGVTDNLKWLNLYFREPARGLGKKGGEVVAEEIALLKEALKLPSVGPYSLSICDQIAALWHFQIVIYDAASPPSVYCMFPHPFSNALPCISLLRSETLPGVCHVEVIKNLSTFWNVRGFACLTEGCKSKPTLHYRNLRHLCKVKNWESCFVCHRPVKNSETYTNNQTEALFCDSKKPKDALKEQCPQCNLDIASLSCKESHLQSGFCSRKGWQCPDCKKFTTGLQKQVRSNHVCHAKPKCKVCFDEKEDENHLCSLNLPRLVKHFDNLGFLHFLSSSSAATCVNCFNNESYGGKKAPPCPVHHSLGPEQEQVPIVCTFSFEELWRGHFSSSTFFDPILNIPQCTRSDYLNFSYIPDHALFASESFNLNAEKKTYNFNKPRRRDLIFEDQVVHLKEKTTKTLAEMFLSKVLSEAFRNFCFLTSGFEAMTYVLRALLENCIPVGGVLRRGTMLIKFVVVPLDITFLCRKQFLKEDISDMAEQFNIELTQIYSPCHFSLLDVPSSTVLPSVTDFYSLYDRNDQVKKKTEFYSKLTDLPFSLKNSLQQCCQTELDIMVLALLKFLKTSFEFQLKCVAHFGPSIISKPDFLSVLHPFSFCSLSGYTYEVFRLFALEPKKLKIVANEFGTESPASYEEMLATEFLRSKEPGQWQTYYSSNLGQKKILCKTTGKLVSIADAYNATTKTLYMFNGCFFHSCPKCDLPNKLEKGSALQKHLVERSEVFKSQIKKYESGLCSPEILHIQLEWECEFKLKKKTDPHLATFLKNPRLRSSRRLVPRDCFRGPRTECYGLQYLKSEADDKECRIVDCSSLFSYVGMEFDMPFGQYQILLSDDIDQSCIGSQDGKLTYQGEQFIGLAQVLVIPGKRTRYPFLATKINGNLVATLCRSCSEKASKQESIKTAIVCTHTDQERSFIDSYTTTELAYALELDYQLFFFELLMYKKFGKFLRPFISLLAFEKIRHSPYPDENWGDAEKEVYCRDMSQRMGFLLTPADICPNKAMRQLSKDALNSYIGFFSVNPQTKSRVQFVRTREELMKLARKREIVNFDFCTPHVMEVSLPNKTNKPNRKTCVTVGCEITACSRIVIHRRMLELVAQGCLILRLSCDSIFFLIKRGQEIPLPFSEAFGCFRHVYKGTILGFLQLGVNNFCVLFGDNGQIETDVKISGLQLSHFLTDNVLNFQFYRDAFFNLISSNLVRFDDKKVFNIRNKTKKLKVVTVRRLQNVVSTGLFVRRQITECSGNFFTLPYGCDSEQ
jgi:hypothetical protein